MLRARQGDPKTEQVVQSVTEGMLTITDTRGQDAVEDWEVDELLEWTNGLNFDQYVKALFLPRFLVCPAGMVIFPRLLPTHLISVNVSRKSITRINLTTSFSLRRYCLSLLYERALENVYISIINGYFTFSRYLYDWKEVATSAGSEYLSGQFLDRL